MPEDYQIEMRKKNAYASRELLKRMLREHGNRPLDQGQLLWAEYWEAYMGGDIERAQPHYDSRAGRWTC